MSGPTQARPSLEHLARHPQRLLHVDRRHPLDRHRVQHDLATSLAPGHAARRGLAEQRGVHPDGVRHDQLARRQLHALDADPPPPSRSPATAADPQAVQIHHAGVQRPHRHAGLDQRDQQGILQRVARLEADLGAGAGPPPPRSGSAPRRDRGPPGERTPGRRAGSAWCASPPRRPRRQRSDSSRSRRATSRGLARTRASSAVHCSRSPGNSRPRARPATRPLETLIASSSARTRAASAPSFSQCSPISRSATVPPRSRQLEQRAGGHAVQRPRPPRRRRTPPESSSRACAPPWRWLRASR